MFQSGRVRSVADVMRLFDEEAEPHQPVRESRSPAAAGSDRPPRGDAIDRRPTGRRSSAAACRSPPPPRPLRPTSDGASPGASPRRHRECGRSSAAVLRRSRCAMKSSEPPSIARIVDPRRPLGGGDVERPCRADAPRAVGSTARPRNTSGVDHRNRRDDHQARRPQGAPCIVAVPVRRNRDQQEQRRRHREGQRALGHRRDRLRLEHERRTCDRFAHISADAGRRGDRAEPRQHADADPRRREQLAREQLPQRRAAT